MYIYIYNTCRIQVFVRLELRRSDRQRAAPLRGFQTQPCTIHSGLSLSFFRSLTPFFSYSLFFLLYLSFGSHSLTFTLSLYVCLCVFLSVGLYYRFPSSAAHNPFCLSFLLPFLTLLFPLLKIFFSFFSPFSFSVCLSVYSSSSSSNC